MTQLLRLILFLLDHIMIQRFSYLNYISTATCRYLFDSPLEIFSKLEECKMWAYVCHSIYVGLHLSFHLLSLNRLRLYFDTRTPIEPNCICDHKALGFGRWTVDNGYKSIIFKWTRFLFEPIIALGSIVYLKWARFLLLV